MIQFLRIKRTIGSKYTFDIFKIIINVSKVKENREKKYKKVKKDLQFCLWLVKKFQNAGKSLKNHTF